MKKVIFAIVLIVSASMVANAQDTKTTVVKDEKTTKPTSSVPQKVHNTFSKHKHYNGHKTTHTKVVKKTTTEPATK